MGIRVGSTVVNVADLEVMTRFWAGLLGLEPSSADPDDRFRLLRGERVNLSLQVAETPVRARDQMHLDLYSDDLAGEVARAVSLGATAQREVDDPGDHYVVLTDPEGNAFCICEKAQL